MLLLTVHGDATTQGFLRVLPTFALSDFQSVRSKLSYPENISGLEKEGSRKMLSSCRHGLGYGGTAVWGAGGSQLRPPRFPVPAGVGEAGRQGSLCPRSKHPARLPATVPSCPGRQMGEGIDLEYLQSRKSTEPEKDRSVVACGWGRVGIGNDC